MEKQAIFDKVKTHLLKQGVKSQSNRRTVLSCLYRGPYSTMCAAGCLIDDAHYTPQMEGMGVKSLMFDFPGALDASIFNMENEPLITALQMLHDEHEPPEWPFRLERIAKNYGLIYSHP